MAQNKTKWIQTLKVGSEVAFLQKTLRSPKWNIVTVEKITPSGRLYLPYGYIINPDGTFRGDKYREIYPVTEEIRVEIAKVELVAKIKNRFDTVDLENATVEQLTNIYASLVASPVKP